MKKVLIAEFKHETSTISPIITGEKNFRDRSYLFGSEVIDRYKGSRTEVGAFIDCLDKYPEIEYVPVMAFNAVPSGPVAQSVFDKAEKSLLDAIDANPGVSGILIAMHGAMITEGSEDGEGTLFESLRKRIGPDVPIMASLDLHCNLTKKMAENATALFPYDYYPHTDSYEAGYRAAECMAGTVLGKLRPVMRCKKLDLLLACLPTALPSIAPFVEREQELRKQPGIINVNLCLGFYMADLYEGGVGVIVVTDGDADRAQKLADEIGKDVWDAREDLVFKFDDLDASIDETLASDKQPYVFADTTDNPGAGTTGDSTRILRRLLERGVKNAAVAIIYDPESVEKAVAAGVGATIDVRLGGKIEPHINGEPIEAKAYVKSISDGICYTKDYCPGTRINTGTTAVLVIDGIEVVTCSLRTQPYDMEVLRANGITPQDKKAIVVKSTIHFRASYEKAAVKIFSIAPEASMPKDPLGMDYKRMRRPIYPLDR